MLQALAKASNAARTENGAAAYRSTYSCCLDFFASCGALRDADDTTVINKFTLAFTEDPDTAVRILFYARDIRGGLGERRLFTTVMKYLADVRPSVVRKNLENFAEYGRYDDILCLLGTKCENHLVNFIKNQLNADTRAMQRGTGVSLLAKWLPSVNASCEETKARARYLCKLLGMTESEYRKKLSALRAHTGVLERSLCEKNYTFDYSEVPSLSFLRYRKAFARNDGERFSEYMQNVRENKASIHADVLYPYDIIRQALRADDENDIAALDAIWKSLPVYADSRNALAVIDGSASMYREYDNGLSPITVALSLGIYFAERNRGRFADHFITFSHTPRLVQIQGNDIADKTRFCMSYNEVSNTDLGRVFMLILNTAVKEKLPQSELPELIYIISDMEFDIGVDMDSTPFEEARKLYTACGYKLPKVVYWNVCARNDHFPVTMNDDGVALVSGASPSIFAQMMSEKVTPISMMRSVLDAPRYSGLRA